MIWTALPDHAPSTAWINRVSAASAISLSNRSVRPFARRSSIRTTGARALTLGKAVVRGVPIGRDSAPSIWGPEALLLQLMTPSINLLTRHVMALRNLCHRRGTNTNGAHNRQLLVIILLWESLSETAKIGL